MGLKLQTQLGEHVYVFLSDYFVGHRTHYRPVNMQIATYSGRDDMISTING